MTLAAQTASAHANVLKASDARYLNSFIRGMAVTQMLGVACKVGLPDGVPLATSIHAAALAQRLDLDPDALWRLVRALSGFGFFEVDAAGAISHSPCSSMLRGEGPQDGGSQHWAAMFWTTPGVWAAWASLEHSLRCGSEGFLHAHGRQFFDHMRERPKEAEVYQAYMSGGYPGRHEAIAAILALSPGEVVIDVGGGSGALGLALSKQCPGARIAVYDQPEVVAGIDSDGVDVMAGDFFASVPSGADSYILSWILHDWPDERALDILKVCRRAMKDDSRLVIVERLIHSSPKDCDPFDLLLDINMLVLHGGKERTEHDFNQLLQRAGFQRLRTIGQLPGCSVFETRPVSATAR